MGKTEKKNKDDLWIRLENTKSILQNAFAKRNSRWLQQFLIKSISVVTLVFLGVVSWRIAWSKWSIDLSKFEFSDLLALIMGLFAISMSVAFYFKATETSNKFYDNVYKFTQETSEILGRIEAGFGERLRHLDEGYSGLQSRFDQFSNLSPEKTKEKEEKNKKREAEAEADKKEATDEKQKLISTLLEKAKLEDKEKAKISTKLQKLEKKYENAEKRLMNLKTERDRMQEEIHRMGRDIFREIRGLEPYLMEIFHHPEFRHFFAKSEGVPFEEIRKNFRRYLHMFPRQIAIELQKQGILSEKGELTSAGYIALKAISSRFRK